MPQPQDFPAYQQFRESSRASAWLDCKRIFCALFIRLPSQFLGAVDVVGDIAAHQGGNVVIVDTVVKRLAM